MSLKYCRYGISTTWMDIVSFHQIFTLCSRSLLSIRLPLLFFFSTTWRFQLDTLSRSRDLFENPLAHSVFWFTLLLKSEDIMIPIGAWNIVHKYFGRWNTKLFSHFPFSRHLIYSPSLDIANIPKSKFEFQLTTLPKKNWSRSHRHSLHIADNLEIRVDIASFVLSKYTYCF